MHTIKNPKSKWPEPMEWKASFYTTLNKVFELKHLHNCVPLYVAVTCIIEGWMPKGSICFFIQKHIEPDHFHPSILGANSWAIYHFLRVKMWNDYICFFFQ